MKTRLAIWSVAALTTVSFRVRADGAAPARYKGPCVECIASLPSGTDPRPVLVLLHGDAETAASMFDAWGSAAAARGVVVLALACPVSKGCNTQSWWQWNGDPSWILRQIKALADVRPIDAERMWIVGWSGGGSYIGFRTQEFERSFAAIVIHGGGVPPARSTCPTKKSSVYFLVGDGNPLHDFGVRLREHYVACEDDVTWTLLKGTDHDGERRAVAAHREAILDFLSTKRLVNTPAVAVALAPTEAGSAPSASASSGPPMSLVRSSSAAPCRCACAGLASRNGAAGLLGGASFVALVSAGRRRRRSTGSRSGCRRWPDRRTR